MKIKKSVFLSSFFLISPLLCSDNDNNINHSAQLPFNLLSHVTNTVGYPTAKNIQTLAIRKSVCDIYTEILKFPHEIQRIITRYPIFNEAFQNIYLQSFKKAINPLTQKKSCCITNLSAFNDDTIAIAQPESFIEIWSLKEHKKIFTCEQIASQANIYVEPLLISSSPEASLYTWNINNNYAHTRIGTNHTQHISLLFPAPNSIVSCGYTGTICIHDTENFITQRTITAHDGQIFVGKAISTNNFITGSLDNYVKEWDKRTQNSINKHLFSYFFIPYGIHNADENHIIVGGAEKKIFILDRRKNLEPIQIFDGSETFDMQSLQDKTIVFGYKALYFTTWNGEKLIEKCSIPITDPMQTMITTPNDTIVYTDSKSNLFYIKPTTRPYHLTQDAAIENAFIALSINEPHYPTS